MTYKAILNDPTEWNEAEPIKCDYCHDNLTPEEVLSQDEDEKYCDDCCDEFIYSCCGDKLSISHMLSPPSQYSPIIVFLLILSRLLFQRYLKIDSLVFLITYNGVGSTHIL